MSNRSSNRVSSSSLSSLELSLPDPRPLSLSDPRPAGEPMTRRSKSSLSSSSSSARAWPRTDGTSSCSPSDRPAATGVISASSWTTSTWNAVMIAGGSRIISGSPAPAGLGGPLGIGFRRSLSSESDPPLPACRPSSSAWRSNSLRCLRSTSSCLSNSSASFSLVSLSISWRIASSSSLACSRRESDSTMWRCKSSRSNPTSAARKASVDSSLWRWSFTSTRNCSSSAFFKMVRCRRSVSSPSSDAKAWSCRQRRSCFSSSCSHAVISSNVGRSGLASSSSAFLMIFLSCSSRRLSLAIAASVLMRISCFRSSVCAVSNMARLRSSRASRSFSLCMRISILCRRWPSSYSKFSSFWKSARSAKSSACLWNSTCCRSLSIRSLNIGS
mmetsp:Transcript_65599/g.154278  ORF Transcript_65599/g.154278 Transcript_65599/m.154278 type:complete len:386 (-) Transcript_65599:1558-2715(-)